MEKISSFMDWWINTVKGDAITNEQMEMIIEKLK